MPLDNHNDINRNSLKAHKYFLIMQELAEDMHISAILN